VGFAVPSVLPRARCALTAPFHPYLRHPCGRHVGGIFLLHFPWARAPQALPGTVSEGARTFLPISCEMQRSPGRLRWARYASEPLTTTRVTHDRDDAARIPDSMASDTACPVSDAPPPVSPRPRTRRRGYSRSRWPPALRPWRLASEPTPPPRPDRSRQHRRRRLQALQPHPPPPA